MTYMEHSGETLTAIRRFQIVNPPLYLHLDDGLITLLASRYHIWSAIPYVLVLIPKVEL